MNAGGNANEDTTEYRTDRIVDIGLYLSRRTEIEDQQTHLQLKNDLVEHIWNKFGNMWSFLAAFKSSNPDSFVNSFLARFGKTGIYKAFMFGSPSIIVTTPDTCRKVLNDDEHFKPGWPLSTEELSGRNSFITIPSKDHKRLRKLTAAPINGHEALSNYIEYIEEISKTTLDKLSKMGEIEFLNQLRKLTFRIIMFIFLSSESESILEALEKEYTTLHPMIKSNIKQEKIIKNRPAGQKGLTLKETRKMPYLSQVVDETLRWVTFTFVVFREAISDCMINGTFLPFGAGSRLCPGNDLAKLEISIFLHHFLLGYRLERTNPECPVQFLPHRRPKDACLARVKKI
uniref:Cytochrome P450 n=1 Tax=Chenopodium quinoa TaxID=63459 RepID=A0A803LIL8_CHEQI